MLQLLLAGILSFPGLLVIVITVPLVAVLSTPALALLIFRKPTGKVSGKSRSTGSRSKSMDCKRVIVTGGSSGIGKAIAVQAAKQGVAEVVILARNAERLERARQEIQAVNAGTVVSALSVDISDDKAVSKAAKAIFSSQNDKDKADATSTASSTIEATHVFCCAGEPHPEYHENLPSETYAQLANVNLLGSIYTAQKCLEHMKAGSITFCSSMAGQLGVFGYTAYCPTKFGIRGFAECLHMELCNNPDIHVQIAYPPDTNTPGFDKENETKPEETRLMSEVAGLAEPSDIGNTMLQQALKENPPFNVYFSFDGFLVATLTAGFGPVSTLFDAVAQISIMSLVRWVSLFYLQDWYRMIRNYQQQSNNKTDKSSTGSKNEKDLEPNESSNLVTTKKEKRVGETDGRQCPLPHSLGSCSSSEASLVAKA